jgi:hypothetical protein
LLPSPTLALHAAVWAWTAANGIIVATEHVATILKIERIGNPLLAARLLPGSDVEALAKIKLAYN